jgi:hypothetical protein
VPTSRPDFRQEAFQNYDCGWLRKHSTAKPELMDVHRLTEIGEHLLGAAAAGIPLVGVASLAADQFLILVGHGAATNPFVVLVDMNMIEFRHDAPFSKVANVWAALI